MQKFISALLIALAAATGYRAQTLSRERVVIETSYGNMTLAFYEETPVHKSNFLKLVDARFFDSLLFHRVIYSFMIQGGDHLSRLAGPGDSLGHGDIGYSLPAEIDRRLIHKKGALCAARESDDINPEFRSSPSQFYLVMGKQRSPEDLKRFEDRINKAHYNNCARAFRASQTGQAMAQKLDHLISENKNDSIKLLTEQLEARIQEAHRKTSDYRFNARQTEVYTSLGGTPHLDNTYTVFGEVTEGIEVIDKIAAAKTDSRDRPLEDIRMRVRRVSSK